MATTYVHDTLASSEHTRLFELLPGDEDDAISAFLHQTLVPDEVDLAPPYTALSYTWGEDKDHTPIEINERTFLVRPNLLAALKALRDPTESRLWWIDAVCINQDDIHEKNQHVARMGHIYRAANLVKIWLGPADEDAARAMEYVRQTSLLPTATGSSNNTLGGMIGLLRRDYWSRTWIVQEIMLAANIDVHCGPLMVSWDDLVSACLPVRRHLPVNFAMSLIEQRTAVVEHRQSLLTQTLESLIRTYHQTKCAVKHDRIFAFLSLASDCVVGQGMVPDYRISRLTLLVQVLEFCQPHNPTGFVSILFTALTKETTDTAWHEAAAHWETSAEMPPSFAPNLVNIDSTIRESQFVRVTYFVPVSSASRDWVRCYTFDAVLDQRAFQRISNAENGEVEDMIRNRSQAARSHQYYDRVCKVSHTHLVFLLHERHLVIFSVFQMRAALSPCSALTLHAHVENCSFAGCAILSTK